MHVVEGKTKRVKSFRTEQDLAVTENRTLLCMYHGTLTHVVRMLPLILEPNGCMSFLIESYFYADPSRGVVRLTLEWQHIHEIPCRDISSSRLMVVWEENAGNSIMTQHTDTIRTQKKLEEIRFSCFS
ncbi:Protein CBG27736 [Caenorhabditis briggsae]|uniref:Protein CBG27736 n=1 Tax=Caenorhabditis briggsae TaxID=6238 RepID=B6IJ34_CAEBR|nr:Protein CBG27736 [Caenorhabditis briggsae]CAS00014.1 Protein CBG27736 [Caenorhabditis briggsae]